MFLPMFRGVGGIAVALNCTYPLPTITWDNKQ